MHRVQELAGGGESPTRLIASSVRVEDQPVHDKPAI
jgi:hypothetical protein